MKKIKLKGKIFSGNGEGKQFLTLLWIKNQIQEKLHFRPYPGTLNVMLSEKNLEFTNLLKNKNCTRIMPADGFCHGIIVPALVNSHKCAIIVPIVAHYPKNILELIAPMNLRHSLNIKDGDEVLIHICL